MADLSTPTKLVSTVAELRDLLSDGCFDRRRVATIMRRLNEIGLLPVGEKSSGRGNSPPISPSHAALCLTALALDTDGDATIAVDQAVKVAQYRLAEVVETRIGGESKRLARGSDLTFGQVLESQLRSAHETGYEPSGWFVSAQEVAQASPRRMVFRGDIEPDPRAVARSTKLPGWLICDVARLFVRCTQDAA